MNNYDFVLSAADFLRIYFASEFNEIRCTLQPASARERERGEIANTQFWRFRPIINSLHLSASSLWSDKFADEMEKLNAILIHDASTSERDSSSKILLLSLLRRRMKN